MVGFDIFVLTVIGLGGIYGYKKGIINVITYWIALFMGYITATKYSTLTYDKLSNYIGDNVWNPISYVVTFLAVFIIVRLAGKLIVKFLKIVKLNLFNRLAGSLFFILLLVILIGLFSHFWLRINKKPISDKEKSEFYSSIEQIGETSTIIFFELMSPKDSITTSP